MKINKDAQKIIDRIAATMQEQPKFNLEAVTKAFQRQYELLGVEMPQVEVTKDMVIGYEIARGAAWDAAWGAAWDAARDAAWGAAWDAAWDAARDAAWGAAWDAARGAARDAARDAAWGAARDAARGAARDAARDAAWGAAWGAARDAAWGAARDAAWGAAVTNTGLKDEATLKYIAIETEMLKALENGLGFYFPMRDKLILVPFPKMSVDERQRLHSTEKAAVDWREGVKFYFIHGARFEKPLWKKITDNKISAKEVLSLSNIEQRMAALRVVGIEKILDNATLVDSVRGYDLYEIRNVFTQTAYYLKYKDPSTDRIYVSGIDPQVGSLKSAPKALAWKFHIDIDEVNDKPLFDMES